MRRAMVLLVLSLAILGACSSGSPPSTAVLTELGKLDAARQLWNEEEPEAYQYVITRKCLACTPQVPWESSLVMVDSTGIKRGTSPFPNSTSGAGLTIAAAFDWIREAVRQDFYYDRQISYDQTYGYPVSARVQDGFGHGFLLEVTEFELQNPA